MMFNNYLHYQITYKDRIVADILGSLHEGDEEMAQLNPEIIEAITSAKKVIFETIFTTTIEEKIKKFTESNKNHLKSYEELYYNYNKLYKKPRERYIQFYPEAKPIFFDSKFSTEDVILKLRSETEESVFGLDSINDLAVIDLYHQLAKKTKNENIEDKDLEKERQMSIIDFALAYKEGNEKIAEKIQSWKQSLDPAFYKHIITNRNENMALGARNYLKNTAPHGIRLLFAIGAGHLLGEKSFQNILMEKLGPDYTIRRCSNYST